MDALHIFLIFFGGWMLRGVFNKLFILGKTVQFSRLAERNSITMLSRASEHYYHSLEMLKMAGEKTERNNEVIRIINNLEFTHRQWQKSAIQAIYEAHPYKSGVQWHDWDTAMRYLQENKTDTRRTRK